MKVCFPQFLPNNNTLDHFLADNNVFSNNRLSMQLLSSNSTSNLVYLNTTHAATAATVFVENLTDQRTRFSQETTNSAFMQAVQNEGMERTFYSWLQDNVCLFALFEITLIIVTNKASRAKGVRLCNGRAW